MAVWAQGDLMLPAAILSVLVRTDSRAAVSQLQKVDAVTKRTGGNLQKMETQTRKTSRSFSGLGSAARTAGALLGGVGLVKGIQAISSEYREAQKVGAQTNAVLKSTGNVAKTSRKDIESLASAISKKTGIDDEAIQSGENLLLTFTKVRNETGKGNDIFNRATQTITDMSVALGQDTKSSAIQLGKALQDPIKGITALRRVGVNFNQQQSDQIKRMVESGDILKAQRTILKELTTEFGGSAAAQATAGDKLRVSLGNLAEASGRVLAPAVDSAARALTRLIDQFVEGRGIARYIIPAFTAMGTAISNTVTTLRNLVVAFKEGNAGAVVLVATIAGLTAGLIAYRTVVVTVTAAQKLLALSFVANPVGLAIAAIIALGAALFIAYKKSETFRNIINQVFATLKGLVPVLASVASSIGGALASAFGAVVSAFNAVVGAVRTAMNAISTEIGRWRVAAAVVRAAVNVIKTVVGPAFQVITGIVRANLTTMFNVIRAIMNQAINAFRTAWNVAKAIFAGAFTALKNSVLGFGQALHGVVQIIGGILKGDFGQIWEGIKNIFSGAIRATTGILRGSVQAFTGAAKAVGKGIVDGIKLALGDIGHIILDRLKDAANWLKDKVGGLFGFIGKVVSGDVGDGIGKAARKLPKMGKPGSLMGANRALSPVAAIGAANGLSVSSGLRPGSITSSGNQSYHSTGEALDLAGPPAGMLKFFRTMRSRFGSRLAELIYTPGGAGIRNGASHTYSGQVAADHYDHVHVALDLGKPGVGDGVGRVGAAAGRFMGDGTGGSNVRRIAAFLKSKGFSNPQIAGILGNLRQESNFDPSAREDGGRGPGHGIAQWSFDRATALKAFARQQGKPWNDLGVQLAFMMHEFQTSERGAYDAVRNSRTVEAAESAFGLKYERYGIMGDRKGRQYLDLARSVGASGGGSGGSGGSQTRAEIERLIERNTTRVETLRRQARHLPSGREGRGRRTKIQDQISSLMTRTRRLRAQMRDLPDAAQRVSPFERQQAAAALGVAEIQRGVSGDITDPTTFVTETGTGAFGYDIKAAYKAADALKKQQQAIGGRIKDLRKALGTRGHSAAARVKYQTELAQLLPQHAELGRQRSALRNPSPEILSGGKEPVTQEDILNMQLAQAGLTPGEGDDNAAKAAMLDFRQGKYLQALQGGDPRIIAEAATALKASMDENNQLTEEANRKREEEMRLMEAHTQALTENSSQMKRQTDIAAAVQSTTTYTLHKALADAVSGQIVGYGVNRRALTPGAGVEVRY